LARTKIEFEKSDLYDLLLDLYKVTTAESRSVGTQMTQLVANSIFGLAILFALITLTLQLFEVGEPGIFMVIIFFLFIVGLFTAFARNYWILYGVLRVHVTTALAIELLLHEIILGKKGEEEIKKEFLDKFPYLNLKPWEKRFLWKHLEKKKMYNLLKKLKNLNS